MDTLQAQDLQEEERLDGFLAADIRQFLETNEQGYIRRFEKALGRQQQFNIGAALTGELWFVHKKMINVGIPLAVIRLLFGVPLCFLYGTEHYRAFTVLGTAAAAFYVLFGIGLGLCADRIYWRHTAAVLDQLGCRNREALPDEELYEKIKGVGRTSNAALGCVLLFYALSLSAAGHMAAEQLEVIEAERRQQEELAKEEFYGGGLYFKYDGEYWSRRCAVLPESRIPALIFTHEEEGQTCTVTVAVVEGHPLSEEEFTEAALAAGEEMGTVENFGSRASSWDIIYDNYAGFLLREADRESRVEINLKRVGPRCYLAAFEYPEEYMYSQLSTEFIELWHGSNILAEVEPLEPDSDDPGGASGTLDRMIFKYMGEDQPE